MPDQPGAGQTARVLPIVSREARAAAAAALRNGQLLAFPTDTVYGVGGNALDPEAARRTYEAKGRPAGKGFPVLLADAQDARRLAAEWPPAAARLTERFWPGALTIVVGGRAEVPDETRTGQTVALRVPDHPLLRDVIRRAGCPLIGTSANHSGQPPALTAEAALQAVGTHVALVLDGGGGGGTPSTVVVVEDGGVRVAREGAVSWEAIEQALRCV